VVTADQLAEKALTSVLSKAEVDHEQIGALFFVSVTGVPSPSIDARLVNRMGL
jgi:alkylresorcinol/alkylpyrone synthase